MDLLAYIERYYIDAVKLWLICRRVLLKFCNNALTFLPKCLPLVAIRCVCLCFRCPEHKPLAQKSGRRGMRVVLTPVSVGPYGSSAWVVIYGIVLLADILFIGNWMSSINPSWNALASRKLRNLILWEDGRLCCQNPEVAAVLSSDFIAFQQQPFPPALCLCS